MSGGNSQLFLTIEPPAPSREPGRPAHNQQAQTSSAQPVIASGDPWAAPSQQAQADTNIPQTVAAGTSITQAPPASSQQAPIGWALLARRCWQGAAEALLDTAGPFPDASGTCWTLLVLLAVVLLAACWLLLVSTAWPSQLYLVSRCGSPVSYRMTPPANG